MPATAGRPGRSKGFGRVLALDGIIQFSQSDEHIYHEMIVHPTLLSHPNPKKFLVIGGGDGGVLREAAKHKLDEMHHVEIDSEIGVKELCIIPRVDDRNFLLYPYIGNARQL